MQMKELTDAPDGYHSAKGVGSTDDVTSFFEVTALAHLVVQI